LLLLALQARKPHAYRRRAAMLILPAVDIAGFTTSPPGSGLLAGIVVHGSLSFGRNLRCSIVGGIGMD